MMVYQAPAPSAFLLLQHPLFPAVADFPAHDAPVFVADADAFLLLQHPLFPDDALPAHDALSEGATLINEPLSAEYCTSL